MGLKADAEKAMLTTPLPRSPFLDIGPREFVYDQAFVDAFMAAIAEPMPDFLTRPSSDYLRATSRTK